MSTSKATGVRGRSPQGARTEAQAISRARRWLNRIVLVSGVVLMGAGLYQGGTALGAQQVERWWDKYGTSLVQIDSEVKEAEAVMHGFLKELGYE